MFVIFFYIIVMTVLDSLCTVLLHILSNALHTPHNNFPNYKFRSHMQTNYKLLPWTLEWFLFL